jgi:hypothetical protein
MSPTNVKVLITPTQYERFEKNKHLPQLSCRLYVRRDHKAGGGHEISTMITNPLFEQFGSGKIGVKSLGKSLSKISKLAMAAAPAAAASGAPQVAAGLAAVGVVGTLAGKVGKTQKANRYRLAKKKTSNT